MSFMIGPNLAVASLVVNTWWFELHRSSVNRVATDPGNPGNPGKTLELKYFFKKPGETLEFSEKPWKSRI